MHKVHDQALDVRAVVVLVGHDHQVAVAQSLDVLVHLGQGWVWGGESFFGDLDFFVCAPSPPLSVCMKSLRV